MSNREKISDAQRDFDGGKRYGGSDGITDIIRPSNPKTSASKGVDFCPKCRAMMFKRSDGWCCTSCGYTTEDPSKKVPQDVTKRKSFFELNIGKHDLKINQELSISGHLNLRFDYVLINAEIDIYLAGKFVESTFTNDEGYFESTFRVKTAGKLEIKVVYKGSSDYEMATAIDYVNVIGKQNTFSSTPKVDNSVISDLERISNLYKQGFLTYEEFQKLKKMYID